MEVAGYFKEGRRSYWTGDWSRAMKSFSEALWLTPEDELSWIYIKGCEYLQTNPFRDDWNGVWVMTSK